MGAKVGALCLPTLQNQAVNRRAGKRERTRHNVNG